MISAQYMICMQDTRQIADSRVPLHHGYGKEIEIYLETIRVFPKQYNWEQIAITQHLSCGITNLQKTIFLF